MFKCCVNTVCEQNRQHCGTPLEQTQTAVIHFVVIVVVVAVVIVVVVVVVVVITCIPCCCRIIQQFYLQTTRCVEWYFIHN